MSQLSKEQGSMDIGAFTSSGKTVVNEDVARKKDRDSRKEDRRDDCDKDRRDRNRDDDRRERPGWDEFEQWKEMKRCVGLRRKRL